MTPVPRPALQVDEEELDRSLRPSSSTTSSVRSGSRSSSRSRSRRPLPRRGARSRPARRPARPRQDEPRLRDPRGARRRDPHRRRPGRRAEGRGRDPDLARGARRPLHRRDPPAARAAEEMLYPALEDFRIDIVMGQGPAARTLALDLPPFTLVGATTRTGLLTTPLRDRFGMTFRLDYYGPEELARIVRRSARILAVEIADEAAGEIARRSRGTPRVANRILRRVRDVAEVRHEGAVTPEIAHEALELLEVDEHGLERIDRSLLEAIVGKFGGGPVGLIDAGRRARRGAGHDRGRLRAVPAPARVHPAHAARPDRHRARPGARRRGAGRPPRTSSCLFDARALGPGRGRALDRRFRPAAPRRRSSASPRPCRAARHRSRSSCATAPCLPARVDPPRAGLRLRHAPAALSPRRRRS